MLSKSWHDLAYLVRVLFSNSSIPQRLSVLLCLLLNAVLTTVLPYIGSSYFSDANTVNIWLVVFIGLCFLISKSLVAYFLRLLGESFSAKLRIHLAHRNIYYASNGLKIKGSDHPETVFTIDILRVREVFDEAVPLFVSGIIVSTVCALLFVSSAPLIFLSLAFLFLAVVILISRFQSLISSLSMDLRDSEDQFILSLSRITQGEELLFGNSYAGSDLSFLSVKSDRIFHRSLKLNNFEAFFQPFLAFTAAVLCYILVQLFSGGSVSYGSNEKLVFSSIILILFLPSLMDLIRALSIIAVHSANISRLVEHFKQDKLTSDRYQYLGDESFLSELKAASNGIWYISGPSGAGKTSLLRYVCKHLDSVSYVPQARPAISANVIDIASFFYGIQLNGEHRSKFIYFLEMLGLSATRVIADNSLESFSGGELGRIYIALALSSSAEYIVLDEPEAGLDSENISRLFSLIETESSSRKIICSSHIAAT